MNVFKLKASKVIGSEEKGSKVSSDKLDCFWPLGVCLSIYLVFVIGSKPAMALDTNNPKTARGCDLTPMAIPAEFNAQTQLTLGAAQVLSKGDKAKLGFRLLLSGEDLRSAAASYIDYFIAQMYADAEELASYRILLLQSALDTGGLEGAALQDALTSLSQLYLAAGDEEKYRQIQLSWYRKNCDPRVVEAKSDAVSQPGKSLDDGSNGDFVTANANLSGSKPMAQPGNSAPKLLQYIEPLYPAQAFEEEISGFVALSFTITKEGYVADLEVMDDEPKGIFEQAALDAVRQWLFRPMVKAGQAVAKPQHRVRLLFDIQVN